MFGRWSLALLLSAGLASRAQPEDPCSLGAPYYAKLDGLYVDENPAHLENGLFRVDVHDDESAYPSGGSGPTELTTGINRRFYFTLCRHELTLHQMMPDLCPEPAASVCITKLDLNQAEYPFLPNAGQLYTNQSLQFESDGRFSLVLDHGQKCKKDGKTLGMYKTRFDFFCSHDVGWSKMSSISYSGRLGFCMFQFMAYTPSVCNLGPLVGEEAEPADTTLPPPSSSEDDACRLRRSEQSDQGADLIDLHQLTTAAGSYVVHSADGQRHFRLNLCGPVQAVSCPAGSLLCEVSVDDKFVSVLVGSAAKVVSWLEPARLNLFEQDVVVLRYIDTMNRAEFEIECAEDVDGTKVEFVETERERLYSEEEGVAKGNKKKITGLDKAKKRPVKPLSSRTLFQFKVQTSLICPRKRTPCTVEDEKSGKKFDLTGLMISRRDDWVAHDYTSDLRYHLSVCQPLPARLLARCPGGPDTSVCQMGNQTQETFSMGQLGQGRESGPKYRAKDESIRLTYVGGSACNDKYNYSTEIAFYCSPVETGPASLGLSKDCRHLFEWKTPFACPLVKEEVKNRGCKILDTTFGNTFDYAGLYNETSDFVVRGKGGETYLINICGDGLLTKCGDDDDDDDDGDPSQKPSICRFESGSKTGSPLAFESAKKMSYNDGQMTLDFTSAKPSSLRCGEDFQDKVTVRMFFMCQHPREGVTETFEPELLSAFDCSFFFTWKTSEACPPFREVQCTAEDLSTGNLYDLSSLSRPGHNYNVQASPSTRFVLNVCRSIVHSPDTKCSYQSSACLSEKLASGDGDSDGDDELPLEQYTGLGRVDTGPRVDDKGQLVLEYVQGSMCTDLDTPELHMSARILFKCNRHLIESQPEFVEKIGCTYHFLWENAAACPLNEKSAKTPSSLLSGKCAARHPITGHLFNLTSLTRSASSGPGTDLETVDENNYKYEVNICEPIAGHDSCGPDAGICRTSPDGRAYINLGRANRDVLLYDPTGNVLFLNYTDGDVCDNATPGKTKLYNSIVRLQCLEINSAFPPDARGHLVLVGMEGHCTAVFDLYTTMACQHTVYCGLTHEGSFFDFSPLMDYEKNYKIELEPNQKPEVTQYLINVCKPVVAEKDGLVCRPENSAVCRAKGDVHGVNMKLDSVGLPATPPQMNIHEEIILVYKNGSVCPQDKSRNMSSSIRFVCDTSAFPGRPQTAAVHSYCELDFTWPTVLACPNASRQFGGGGHALAPGQGNCLVYHQLLRGFIDLKRLLRNSSYQVEKYVVRPCEPPPSSVPAAIPVANAKHRCNGSICLGEQSFGTLRSAYYNYDEDVLHVRYESQEVCQGPNYTRKSEIRFLCDHEADEESTWPTVYADLPCKVIFEWRTRVACEVVHPNRRAKAEAEAAKAAAEVDRKGAQGSGSSRVTIVSLLLLFLVILAIVVYLLKRDHRTTARRKLFWLRDRLTPRAWSRRDGDNPLINDLQVPAFSELNQQDYDDDLILA